MKSQKKILLIGTLLAAVSIRDILNPDYRKQVTIMLDNVYRVKCRLQIDLPETLYR